jgi:hypothetical protein
MNIVAKYKNTIKCKKTNALTWTEKNAAWDRITQEFNSQTPHGVLREKESLKKCYENKKMLVRKLAASNKKEIRATGGGSFTPQVDPCLDIVMNITNKKTIEGLPDEFGGDATFEIIEEDNVENLFEEENNNDVSTKEDHHARSSTSNELVGSPLSQEVSNSSQNKNDWNSYKPGDIKNAPSKKLRFKTDRRRLRVVTPIHTNFLSKQYSELASLKEAYLRRETEIISSKEARDNEEHQLRKRSLQLDIEIKEMQLKCISSYK